MKEEELFPPIKTLFESLGYRVNAEVKNCDVTAIRDDELIVIELKKTLSVKLLAQGIDRQRTGANVFVAIPKPKNYTDRKFREIFKVIKKLELGLILVTVSDSFNLAEIVFEPTPFKSSNVYKVRKSTLINEINARSCDVNTGGMTQKKIVTAYTEQCVHIACLLEKYGDMSPKQLRVLGSDAKRTQSILASNFYGWFCRVEKGIYSLTKLGHKYANIYPEVSVYYKNLVDSQQTNPTD